MMTLQLLGVRHGFSFPQKKGIIVSHPDQARFRRNGLHYPEGHQQTCEDFKQWTNDHLDLLEKNRGKITIYTSDASRGRETAGILADVLAGHLADHTNLKLRVDTRLRERFFGTWDGGPNTAYERVWAKDALKPSHTDDGVESVDKVVERMASFVSDIQELHSYAGVAGIAFLVSHGDALQIYQAHALGWSPARHREMPPWKNNEIRPLGIQG